MKNLYFLGLLLPLIFYCSSINAQCSGCTITHNTATGNITVNSGQTLCITFAGTFTGQVNLRANANLCISSSTVYTGSLNLWGNNASVQNHGTWNTSLNMTNRLTFNNFGTFDVGSLQVNSNATFTSTTDITVTGDITNNGTFNVAGSVTARDFSSNSGSVVIGGDLNARDVRTNSPMQVGGDANLTGNLQVNGTATLTIAGDATVAGNVENNGTLDFQSSTTIQGNLSNNGDLTFESTFSVTGDVASNSGSTLTANGAGTIGGDLDVNQADIDFNGNTDIGGDVAVNSGSTLDFNVGGSVGGDVDVNGGTLTANDSTVDITGDLTNNGSIQAGGACGRFNVGGETRNNSGTVGTNNVQLDICDSSAPQSPPNNGWDVQFAGAGNFGSNLSYCTCSPTPLPIELLSFTTKNVENGILLNWKTALEIDNDYFQVERAPFNNISNFNSIGFVQAVSETNPINNYNFTDTEVRSSEKYYYRLKQLDVDGSFNYSPIIVAEYESDSSLKWRIKSSSWELENIGTNQSVQIGVYNIFGERIEKCTLTKDIFKIDVSSLSKGIYIIKYIQGSKVLTQKVNH
ncbi:T9SS type A sorting domain-containing protein [Bernardetia sp.]|uniref:T9SS type A sorting domain-containing protein n=1 Tax=Bernardetia sp. TaxID=1937974 RepID=UPI0025BA8E60|nr:T9SS type A sorting domain-containing protein [Bernardetia sp.]